jgi:hypothetical protein
MLKSETGPSISLINSNWSWLFRGWHTGAVDNHIYLIESLQRIAEGDLHTFLAQYGRK